MPSLLSEFWQYLKDAAPGGALNPETPKLGGLLNKGAEELAASLREYGASNKAAIDNPSWDNVKRAVDGNMAAAGMAPLGMVAPRASAMETARKNAVKMLGLPENNTAMDRAKALGFDTPAYRGTTASEKIAKESKFGAMGPAHYSGDDAIVANAYAGDEKGANVIPLLLRGDYIDNKQWTELVSKHGWDGAKKEAMKNGISGVHDAKFENAYATFIPSAVRSRFAAFDPARIHEADLLGQATPEIMPWLLGAGLLGAGGVAAYEKPSLLRDLFSGVPPEPDQQNWLQRQLIPQTQSRPTGVRG